MTTPPDDAVGPVLVVGARGEFGGFLRTDVLPALGVTDVLDADRDTPADAYPALLARARHAVVATPLDGYADLAVALVEAARAVRTPTTFWLLPSVQAGVGRAVTDALDAAANPHLGAVLAHPMYGPNGFRAAEPEARTFQNVLTATHGRPGVAAEVARVAARFRTALGIATTAAFDPDAHDRITARTQGLSYAVARVLFARPAVDAEAATRLPDLHGSFHANRALIGAFLRANAHVPPVLAAFDAAGGPRAATLADALRAFAATDAALNGDAPAPIPTKWYARLRDAARAPG